LRLFPRRHLKFGADRTILDVRVKCVFSIFKMAAVRHLGFGVTSYRTNPDLQAYLMVLTPS